MDAVLLAAFQDGVPYGALLPRHPAHTAPSVSLQGCFIHAPDLSCPTVGEKGGAYRTLTLKHQTMTKKRT